MTEKEKAEAYDEAIERAKKLYGNGIAEEIFTELKENDTERIRKNCIHFLELQKQHHAATFEIEECITWLEKQGKKSTDKTKPSFNVGDWVVLITSKSVYQVEKKENYEYTLKNIHGGSFCVSFSNEELIREWTIEDAKDGDVIFYDEGWICIFKCIHGIWYSSYCFITDDGEFHTGYERHAVDSTIHGNAHPATKEQCDAFMKIMKDAGYKWDAEKKELRKEKVK